MPEPKYYLFCGDDDYVVDGDARECFNKLAANATGDFSREIIDASCAKVEDVETALHSFLAAIRTVSMFSDKNYVWLRGLNWLTRGTKLASIEGTKDAVEKLLNGLAKIDPASVGIVISAFSPDGVRKDTKRLKELGKTTNFPLVNDKGNAREVLLDKLLEDEVAAQKVTATAAVRAELLAKVGGNIRLAVEEVRKLACYLGTSGGKITSDMVTRLVPDFGEGDFFEPAEAFFSAKIDWALEALHRFFFKNPDGGRALHVTMLRRNRLLLQLRLLLDGGAKVNSFSGLQGAEKFKTAFGNATEKSELNIFTQHPYYLSRLVPNAQKFSLKKLIDIQLALTQTFFALINRPNDDEQIFRELFSKQLAG
jgi:DNA polymerase-3 subunit delta